MTATEGDHRYSEIIHELDVLYPDAWGLLSELDNVVGSRLATATKRGVAAVLPYVAVAAEVRPLVARAGVLAAIGVTDDDTLGLDTLALVDELYAR